jgi:hypothetical protein
MAEMTATFRDVNASLQNLKKAKLSLSMLHYFRLQYVDYLLTAV